MTARSSIKVSWRKDGSGLIECAAVEKLGIWTQFLNISLQGCIVTKFRNAGRAAYGQRF